MDHEEFLGALKALGGHAIPLSGGDEDEPKAAPTQDKAIQARVLLDVLPDLEHPNPFAPGMLVEQRPNYGNYRFPAQGHLAIVTRVYPPLLKNCGEDLASPASREDMVILCLVQRRWVEYAVESWRFQAYAGPIEG